MGVFVDLEARLQTLCDSNGVATLVHDRLDSINEDSANNYPMLLYRITSEQSTTYNKDQDNPLLNIEFFLSDLWYSGSTDTLSTKMDSMVERLDSVIKDIPLAGTNYFRIFGSSNAEYAWEQYNDNLFVVKRTVQIYSSRLNCDVIPPN